MRNKTHLFTTIGILFLVIGSSFLVGTIYRSTWTSGGQIGVGHGGGGSVVFSGVYSLSPRNYALLLDLTYYDAIFNLEPISSVDFYLLDSKSRDLWFSEGVIEPVWFAKEVSPTGTLHMRIPHRGDYFLLLINPDGSDISGFLFPKLYGYESDLLGFSIIMLVIGSIMTVLSALRLRNKNRQLISADIDLKKDDNKSRNSGGSSVLLSENVEAGVSLAEGGGGLGFWGSLRRLLVWELEMCFVFPLLEVLLVGVVLTVLTPAIIEVSSVFRYANLLSGVQPVVLFLIFFVGVLFCHSYAGGLSRGETKMVLSYPVRRGSVFLSKFIALFAVISVVYVGVFALQIPLLSLSPFEPMFYASLLLVLLEIFLVCTLSTVLSVVTKHEVFSILASALLLFGIESIASSSSLVTFTGRFSVGFSFVRQQFYGGLFSVSLFDVLVSIFVMLGVSVLLFICSYVYFTRKMEID